MDMTPLLAVQLMAAFLALLASVCIKRLFTSLRLFQKVKQYPGKLASLSPQTAKHIACTKVAPDDPPRIAIELKCRSLTCIDIKMRCTSHPCYIERAAGPLYGELYFGISF